MTILTPPKAAAQQTGTPAWQAPTTPTISRATVANAQPASHLASAEQFYAAAIQQERSAIPECVDAYFWATLHAWQVFGHVAPGSDDPTYHRAWTIYHATLAKLIEVGQRYGRLDPSRGLMVRVGQENAWVSTSYHGFPWQPSDFRQLLVVGSYSTTKLQRVHRRSGLGVPLIVTRDAQSRHPFVAAEGVFSATAVLRGEVASVDASSATPTASSLRGVSLELYDNLPISSFTTPHATFPLGSDSSAHVAFVIENAQQSYFEDLFAPYRPDVREGLRFVTPYQPGKIPIIFIHGLLSDPLTWADLANDLWAHPEITHRYQFWVFQYPTGKPFLESAADLRSQLAQALATLDPQGQDPALRKIVLVGHSMGGLVSKLQAVSSGSAIWYSYAKRPPEQVLASPETHAYLRQVFFFDAQPYIRRVVFIAAPHGGSSLATRWFARIASARIRTSDQVQSRHNELVQANPGVFPADISKAHPNSIQLLEPNNPLLTAMRPMPISPHIRTHSIIGHGFPMLNGDDADRVVPVKSAQHPGVQSERFVHAKHTEVHHQLETVSELVRILTLHLAETP